jgi:hypothetical protein
MTVTTRAHPTNRHWCCGEDGPCLNGRFEDLYCKSIHPFADDVICTRLTGHDGPHRGYVFSITEPAEWS